MTLPRLDPGFEADARAGRWSPAERAAVAEWDDLLDRLDELADAGDYGAEYDRLNAAVHAGAPPIVMEALSRTLIAEYAARHDPDEPTFCPSAARRARRFHRRLYGRRGLSWHARLSPRTLDHLADVLDTLTVADAMHLVETGTDPPPLDDPTTAPLLRTGPPTTRVSVAA